MMKKLVLTLSVAISGLLLVTGQGHTQPGGEKTVGTAQAMKCAGLLNHEVRYLNNSQRVRLCEAYAGKLALIVNTASKCAYTNQYDGLEKLYERYKDKGLVILGFPSNDFGAQEPGTEKEIQNFCRLTYSVNFPMFSKTSVLEQNADPIYRELAQASGRYPAWNFHKYLVDRNGQLIADFPSHVDPFDPGLVNLIESNL
jgi:glutathione peroxidase